MEVNEGQIRISQVPYITIADKPLGECKTPLIAREIQRMCKMLEEQRKTIKLLRAELAKIAEEAADVPE